MRLRRLTMGEITLARAVFGEAIDPGRVRMLNGAPTGPWAMVIFGLMLFPTDTADFAVEPIARQAWFVHELTHVRQFQTRPWRTLMSWAGVALSGGYLTGRAYDPRKLGGAPNLEQEAKAVEHAFLMRRGERPRDLPEGARLEDDVAISLTDSFPPQRGKGRDWG
jgi:hypothetical protein